MSIALEIEHGMEALISYGKIKHEKNPGIWHRYLPPESPFGDEFKDDYYNLSSLIEEHDDRFFIIRWFKRFIYPRQIEKQRAYLSYIETMNAYNMLRYGSHSIQADDIKTLEKLRGSLSLFSGMRYYVRQLIHFYKKTLDPKERAKEKEEEAAMYRAEGLLFQKELYKDINEQIKTLFANVDLTKDPNLKAFVEELDQTIVELKKRLEDCQTAEELRQLVTYIHEVKENFNRKKEPLFKETDEKYSSKGFFNWVSQTTKWLFTKRNERIEIKIKELETASQGIFTQAVIKVIDLELAKFREDHLPSQATYDPRRDYKDEILPKFEKYVEERFEVYKNCYGGLLTKTLDYAKAQRGRSQSVTRKVGEALDKMHTAKADALCEEMLNKLHEMGREYVASYEALEGASIEEISNSEGGLYSEFDRRSDKLRKYYYETVYGNCFNRAILDDWFDKFSKTRRQYLDLSDTIYGRKCDEIREQGATIRNAELTAALKEAEEKVKTWQQRSPEQRCKDDLTLRLDWPQYAVIATTSTLAAMQTYQSDLLKLNRNYFKLTYILNYYAQNSIPVELLKEMVDDYCAQCKRTTKQLLRKYAFDKNVKNANSGEVTDFIQYCPEKFKNLNEAVNDAMAVYQVALGNRHTNTFVSDNATKLFGELVKEINNKIQAMVKPPSQGAGSSGNTMQYVN